MTWDNPTADEWSDLALIDPDQWAENIIDTADAKRGEQ